MQYKAITGGITYALQAPKLHLMMACHMPSIYSRTAYNGGMAYAAQAPELHVMRAWHICHELGNCMH